MLLPAVKVKTVIVVAKGEQVPSIAGLRECWRQSRLAADYVRMKLPSCFRIIIRYGMFFILPGYFDYSVRFGNYRGYGLMYVKKLYRINNGLSILIYFNLLQGFSVS